MKQRFVVGAAAVALVALATASNRLLRPANLAWATPDRAPAPSLVAADSAAPTALRVPRVKAPPSMVAVPRRSPKKAVSPVAAPAPAAGPLPPSIVLVSPPDPRPSGMPIALAPAPGDARRASPVAAAAGAPPVAAGPLVATPPAAPATDPAASAAAPADSNNLWVEKQSNHEQPEIHLFNRSRLSGELVIRQGSARRAWAWRRSGLVISDTVDPVEYTYEVRGPIYRATGRPDVAGSLRCRKYRVYEIEVWERSPWEGWDTMIRDLGD